MVDGVGVVADDTLPVLVGEGLVVLAVGVGVGVELGAELLKRRHFGDLQAFLDSDDECLDIQGIVKMIGFDDRILERVCRMKRDPASTFRMMKNWKYFKTNERL